MGWYGAVPLPQLAAGTGSRWELGPPYIDQMSRCVFCKSQKTMTVEHVLPQWIGTELQVTGGVEARRGPAGDHM
jgi:hypothetical protein